ncbi:MAG: 5-methylcytosine-specific restriction endonuclease system specificity protein McrC [Ruminococcus sp.]|nr:5-methylcytosine-specific restriction endonuclease system specificity protein McrC [Ruminococcus sp.]
MIPIKNIFYMLAYAFSTLNSQGYKKIETEEFENVADLCSAILIKGVSSQIKQGLNKDYLERDEAISSLRGKIDITQSIKEHTILRRQMYCCFDEFSTNSYMNQILKTTMGLLLRSNISLSRKKELRRLLVYFADVDTLDINSIDWHQRYNRNNQTYRMLISICYLVIKGLLQTQADGSTKLMDFLDDQHMHRLYEKFILEYYRKEFPDIKNSSPQIPWQIDDGYFDMLPVMQSDVVLEYRDKILIIDAKYYSHNLQIHYDSQSIHSGNLYQIFTYTKNKSLEAGSDKEVSGLLLYAKTDDFIQPDQEYSMSGNTIGVKSLDLDCDFNGIKQQLNNLVAKYF